MVVISNDAAIFLVFSTIEFNEGICFEQFLHTFLEEKPIKRKLADEVGHFHLYICLFLVYYSFKSDYSLTSCLSLNYIILSKST